MRRLVLGFVILAGLASSCGGSTPRQAHHATTVAPASATDTPAVAVAWTPVIAAQFEAAQLAVEEQQYAWCFVYARLDQSLADGAGEQCSPTGLTSAEVGEIQDLIIATQ